MSSNFYLLLIYIDVAKEIEEQKAMWGDKRTEIENKFKEVYQIPQPAPKVRKRRNLKQPQKVESKELSMYAGCLTKEFMIKVSELT